MDEDEVDTIELIEDELEGELKVELEWVGGWLG